jgi:hypothetical protein
MYNELAATYLNLPEAALAFLQIVEQQMSIIADLSRADILLYGRKSADELLVFSSLPMPSPIHWPTSIARLEPAGWSATAIALKSFGR